MSNKDTEVFDPSRIIVLDKDDQKIGALTKVNGYGIPVGIPILKLENGESRDLTKAEMSAYADIQQGVAEYSYSIQVGA